jgi:hypothetical protein
LFLNIEFLIFFAVEGSAVGNAQMFLRKGFATFWANLFGMDQPVFLQHKLLFPPQEVETVISRFKDEC